MKILLVTSRYPWPPRRGDQMRAVQMLDFLADEHEVTLLAPAPGSDQPAPAEGAPYQVELYRPGGGAAFLAGMARAVAKRLPLQTGLFHQPSDAGSASWRRATTSASSNSCVSRATPTTSARRRSSWTSSTACRSISRRGPRWIAGGSRLSFGWKRDCSPGRSEAGPILAVTGNLGYFVNADAVTWWLRDVWPRMRQVRPDVRLVIAGDRPAWRLRRAVEKAGARLIESPRDLRSVLVEAAVSLAPMRSGSGVPIKILEAWAAGIPVVASPWAAAGTSGRPGEDFLVTDLKPVEWIAAVTDLLDSPSSRRRLIENGRRRLAADYSRATVRRRLQELLQEIRPSPATEPLPHRW
jgi:hypothetical protein